LFELFGLGPRHALLLVLTLGAFVGGWTLQKLLRRWGIQPAWVWLGLILWFAAPHHEVNLQVWNTWPQQLGLWLLPLPLWGIESRLQARNARERVQGSAWIASGLALQLLIHNITALFSAGLTLVYLALRLRTQGERRDGLACLLAAATGLAVTAFQWLPALLDIELAQLRAMTAEHFDPVAQAVYPQQLFAWDFPRGMSVPGPDDAVSFSLGPVQILLAFTKALFAWRGPRQPERTSALLFLALGLGLVFLITPAGAPSFYWIPLLNYVNVPARLLGVIALLIALAVPIGLRALRFQKKAALGWLLSGLALASLIPAVWEAPPLSPELRAAVEPVLEGAAEQQVQLPGMYSTTTVFHEYLPRDARLPVGPRPPQAETPLVLHDFERGCGGVQLSGVQTEGGRLRLPLLPYPDLVLTPEAIGTLQAAEDHVVFEPSQTGPFEAHITYDRSQRYPGLGGFSALALLIALGISVRSLYAERDAGHTASTTATASRTDSEGAPEGGKG
jgi:hypothetical protein